jgi:tetratricopeptide (TPR) repeat protein
VASRTSAFAFKGSGSSIPEIAGQLGVRYVLEGSVRKSGAKVRITAQLIDAQNDRHLWSDTFDRTLDDIFAVQDEIAAAIGNALQVRLLGDQGEAVIAESIDPENYEAFLEARFLLRRRSSEAIQSAIDKLEPMVEAEPAFARGMALLAEAYLLGRRNTANFTAHATRCRELAEKALSLDPNLASAYMILGSLAGDEGDWVARYRGYRRAIELEPEEPRPHHWLALLYGESGLLDDGLREINEAIRLEPENANARGWRSTLHSATGDYGSAVADALAQAGFGNPNGHLQAANHHLKAGEFDQADAEYQLAAVSGVEEAEIMRNLVRVGRGDPEAAQPVLTLLQTDREIDPYDILQGLLSIGLWDEYLAYRDANSQLERWIPLHTLVWHRDFAPMRADPRFRQTLETKGIIALWREIGAPEDCQPDGESFACGHGGGQ